MHVCIFITIFLAIIIAIAYSLVVHLRANKEIWNWWHTFIASIVSILFGIAVGISLIYIQGRITDESRMNQFKILLAAEMRNNVKSLDSNNKMNFAKIRINNKEYRLIITYFEPIALRHAVSSGLFDSTKTKIMINLIRIIEIYNSEVKYLYSTNSTTNAESLVHGIKKRCGAIKARSNNILRILGEPVYT